jgi:hypothetical protein
MAGWGYGVFGPQISLMTQIENFTSKHLILWGGFTAGI